LGDDPTTDALGSSGLGARAASIVASPVVPIAIGVALIAEALLHQAILPINHDVGWLLVATERMLEGGDIYGEDLVEFNPPMILYLLAPAIALARLLGTSEIVGLRIEIALLAIGSLALCNAVLKRIFSGDQAQARRYLLVLLAAVFMVDRTRSFGQRDHLVILLLAPYLLLATSRLLKVEQSHRVAALTGVAAGLAISLKPHYLLILAALEPLIVLRTRPFTSISALLWRPELIAIGALGTLYVVSLFVFTPGYPSFVLPLSLDTYWAYQKPSLRLIRVEHLLLLGLTGVLVWLVRESRALRALGVVLLTSAAAFYAVSVLQGTGWRYHLIPFYSVLVVAAALPLLDLGLSRGSIGPALGRLGRVVAVVIAVLSTWLLLAAGPKGHWGGLVGAVGVWRSGGRLGTESELRQLVAEHASDGTIYAISASVKLGFPLVNLTGVEWSSRFSHLWPLAAVVRWQDAQARAAAPAPAAERVRMQEIERYVVDAVVADFAKRPPDLVLVDLPWRARRVLGRHFDYLEYFSRDPRFRETWAQYELIKQTPATQIYARRSSGP
jgi:hypothetical protein